MESYTSLISFFYLLRNLYFHYVSEQNFLVQNFDKTQNKTTKKIMEK